MLYDLIVIGGGPAGITAGIYAGRQTMKTLLITKEFGGQIGKKAVEIENWPGYKKITGIDLIRNFENHVESQDIEITTAEVRKVEKKGDNFLVSASDKKTFESKTIIVATGGDPRPLEVPGEKEFIGKGVSYCATCDGPLFKNKDIAVIGGGNAGFEAAIFMANYARKIYILECSSKPKAAGKTIETALENKKIELIINAAVKKIEGDKFVNKLIFEDTKLKKEKELDIQGILVEIGNQPATSYVKGLVDFNERDEIMVEFETYQTKTPGLFAAGDVNVGRYKQIITACGEGCKAALSAYGYLQNLKYRK